MQSILNLTMIIVACQVLSVYEKIVVLVQLPELAVYHIEVLVAEKVCHLVDIVLILHKPQCRKEL